MNPPAKLMAADIHRIYCDCGRSNMADVMAAEAWNKEHRHQTTSRFGLVEIDDPTNRPLPRAWVEEDTP